MTSRQENLNCLLDGSEGYIIIFLNKGGTLESRLKNEHEVFESLWDSFPGSDKKREPGCSTNLLQKEAVVSRIPGPPAIVKSSSYYDDEGEDVIEVEDDDIVTTSRVVGLSSNKPPVIYERGNA